MTDTIAKLMPQRPPRSMCDNHTDYTPGCPGCQAANRNHQAWHRRQRAYGRHTGRVDANIVREHLQPLIDAGMTASSIAAQTESVGRDCVEDILGGRCRWVYARNAAQLLAVTLNLPPNALVSSLDSSRRLQALACNGWDATTIADRLGAGARPKKIQRWRRREYPTLAMFRHQAIAELYGLLLQDRGASEATARLALRARWKPPEHPDNADLLPAPKPGRPLTVVLKSAGSGLMCDGRDVRMWEVGDPRNREAVALCNRCPGCPPLDDKPILQIRDGIPYSRKGVPLPLCPQCGQPNVDYRGGTVTSCAACLPPSAAVAPHRELVTRLYVVEGLPPSKIAPLIDAKPAAVRDAVKRWKLRRDTGRAAA